MRTEDPEGGNVSKAIGSSIPNFTIFMGGIPNIKTYVWFHYCSTNHTLTLWESNTATENPRFSLDNHLESRKWHVPFPSSDCRGRDRKRLSFSGTHDSPGIMGLGAFLDSDGFRELKAASFRLVKEFTQNIIVDFFDAWNPWFFVGWQVSLPEASKSFFQAVICCDGGRTYTRTLGWWKSHWSTSHAWIYNKCIHMWCIYIYVNIS